MVIDSRTDVNNDMVKKKFSLPCIGANNAYRTQILLCTIQQAFLKKNILIYPCSTTNRKSDRHAQERDMKGSVITGDALFQYQISILLRSTCKSTICSRLLIWKQELMKKPINNYSNVNNFQQLQIASCHRTRWFS